MIKAKVARDTFAVYHSMFLDSLEAANAAPLTRDTYGVAVQQLGDFLRSQGMPLDPTVLTREHLTEFMLHVQRPKAEGGRGLSPAAANQRFRSLASFFKFLIKTDEIKESPLAKMSAPKIPEHLVPVIKDDDLRKLLKTVSGSDFESRRDKAIISLFIDTGVRLSEMAGIDLSDFDSGEREIVVLGKDRRPRRIRIVTETRSDINRYLLKRADHPHADDDDGLWLGKRGKLTDSGVYRMIVKRCKAAGLPPVHPHMFRHTFAHMYLRGGGNEGDLMKVAGWRSREMVDRYGRSAGAERAGEAHDRFSPRKSL